MNEWLKISFLLCVFGFLKEIRPSEPFIYEYLVGPWWNITEEEVVQEVYPVGTYAYLAQLVVVFLITDLCRYKPLIIVLALAGVTVWSMLIWSTTLLEVQILESTYLSSLGGRELTSKTNRVLKYLLADQLAAAYSFYRKRLNKKTFHELLLYSVIVRAVKSNSSHTDKAIKDCIQIWLKHAPRRFKTTESKQAALYLVAYGTFMAAEVAYYTYIYAKVPKEYYPQVTAHTRAAILAGRCLSGTIAQVLLEFDVMDYKSLNYITFSAMITATIWSLFLPSVPKSIYFHRDPEKQSLTSKGKYQSAFALMKSHFVESFSNSYVAKWSIWWALATSGFIQVQTYMQPLWSDIHTVPNSTLHNGTVEAVLTLVGCLGALSIGFIKTDWKVRGELVLSLCSILSGALLIISSQTSHIIVSYACYVVFGGLYHFVITIATSEVAKYILEDSYGIVFGLNTLIALVLQTLVTLCLVTGDIGWALTPRNQHLAYGIYHMCIAVVFIIIGIVDWLRNQADITKTY